MRVDERQHEGRVSRRTFFSGCSLSFRSRCRVRRNVQAGLSQIKLLPTDSESCRAFTRKKAQVLLISWPSSRKLLAGGCRANQPACYRRFFSAWSVVLSPPRHECTTTLRALRLRAAPHRGGVAVHVPWPAEVRPAWRTDGASHLVGWRGHGDRDRRRAAHHDRVPDGAGGVHLQRRDGLRVLHDAPAESHLADLQRRRARGSVLVHLSLHRDARLRDH